MSNIIKKAVIVYVDKEWNNSLHGGNYKKVLFQDIETGKQYTFYCYDQLESSKRFIKYLELNTVFENLLRLKTNLSYIDGNSDFRVLGKSYWKEEESAPMKSYRLSDENEPEILHIIKSGFNNPFEHYHICSENPYMLDMEKKYNCEFLTKEQIFEKYKIIIDF